MPWPRYTALERRLLDTLPASIAGIPCAIRPTRFLSVKGSYDRNAGSDLDYFGYDEIEFEVLDRKGYPAAWLEAKMTRQDRQEIERGILEQATRNAEDSRH